MNEDKVRELVANVQHLMEVHKRKHETFEQLFRVCLKHLEDRRRFIPKETWAEREQLITALKELFNE